jgi:RNA polymerase sporulation-specific sigma factor
MNKLKKYNDYELLYLIGENNEEAHEILYAKYRPVIELKAKKYYRFAARKGLDFNDLVQEGMIGLSEALKDFKEDKNIKLSTFASLCIERQINSAVLSANRKKHTLLNDSVSLDYISGDDYRPLIDLVTTEKNYNPLDHMVETENREEFLCELEKKLTDFEYQVLQLQLQNFNYREIANILDKPVKSVDNALQRAKSKVKKIIKLLTYD